MLTHKYTSAIHRGEGYILSKVLQKGTANEGIARVIAVAMKGRHFDLLPQPTGNRIVIAEVRKLWEGVCVWGGVNGSAIGWHCKGLFCIG